MKKACLIIGIILLVSILGGLGYYIYTQNNRIAELEEKLNQKQEENKESSNTNPEEVSKILSEKEAEELFKSRYESDLGVVAEFSTHESSLELLASKHCPNLNSNTTCLTMNKIYELYPNFDESFLRQLPILKNVEKDGEGHFIINQNGRGTDLSYVKYKKMEITKITENKIEYRTVHEFCEEPNNECKTFETLPKKERSFDYILEKRNDKWIVVLLELPF